MVYCFCLLFIFKRNSLKFVGFYGKIALQLIVTTYEYNQRTSLSLAEHFLVLVKSKKEGTLRCKSGNVQEANART